MVTWTTWLWCSLSVIVLVCVAAYDPPKRKPDWRHLTNKDRLSIYRCARFDALGDSELEPNLKREADGREAKERILSHWMHAQNPKEPA